MGILTHNPWPELADLRDVDLAMPVDGEVLTYDIGSGKWENRPVPAPPAAAVSVLHWGNNAVTATATTRYLSPGWEDGAAPTLPVAYVFPAASGTLQRLVVRHNIPRGNGNQIVYTVRKNGVATALAVSLASTGTTGSDLVHSVALVAGDVLDVEVTKVAGVGTSPADIMATLELSA